MYHPIKRKQEKPLYIRVFLEVGHTGFEPVTSTLST